MAKVKSVYGSILEIASLAGKCILENGGEIYRVEQTVLHVCNTYGIQNCECFATPTAIIASIIDEGGEVHTVVRRISHRQVNLAKIDAVNTFSRTLGDTSPSFSDAKKRLLQIDQMASYPFIVLLLASALGVGAFTIVFTGNWSNVLGGMLAGAVTRLCTQLLAHFQAGTFFINMVGGMVSTLVGWFSILVGWGDSWWILILSSLMLLVPGMLITNALRDIAAGDLISGGSRGVEAISIAAALSCGTAICTAVLLRLGDIVLWV